jgi:DHA2 family multidrug resistance protein-like MFS transporter
MAAATAALPPDLAESARGTIGGAVSVAGALPEAPGAELLGAARAAFARAFQATALIGAAISVSVALLAAWLLRGVRPVAHPAQA